LNFIEGVGKARGEGKKKNLVFKTLYGGAGRGRGEERRKKRYWALTECVIKKGLVFRKFRFAEKTGGEWGSPELRFLEGSFRTPGQGVF